MTNILIIDDSSFARTSLRKIFSSAGYHVTEAASGEDAIEAAKLQTPDLVTLDLLMPGLSGLETLLQMRPVYPQTGFIIITADIQTSIHDELINAGANAFLNKPVSREELLSVAADLLGQA